MQAQEHVAWDTLHHQNDMFQPDGSEFVKGGNNASSLKDFCGKGHIHGHFRNYFMYTVNEGQLLDYWSNAMGGALAYESAIWKGFQFGVKGIFSYRTLTSNLNRVDSIVGKSAKWEAELYDINRPQEGSDLDRLEELYVRYYIKQKSFIELGKIDINEGPLFLRRDGRMKPFVYRGLWAELYLPKGKSLRGGWINGVSPRAMTEWFSIREAIGMISRGFQPEGMASHYHEAAPSRGIAAIGYSHQLHTQLNLQFWNYYFDRLSNISWLQMDWKGDRWFGGLQYALQVADPYQSKLEYDQRYYQPDEQGQVLNAVGGIKAGILKFSASYLHSFASGRFIYARELGRENFYVSQPRSWIDGLGQANVYMLRFQLAPGSEKSQHFIGDLRISYTDTHSTEVSRFNKYLVPDYLQTTLQLRYRFTSIFEGLELMLLYIARMSPNAESLDLADKFYRTDFHHLNFVSNINF